MIRHALRTAGFAFVFAAGLSAYLAPPAVPAETFTVVSSHPSIAAQPTSGRYVYDLAYHAGEIYMGYGDWTANTGPIDIATYNPATGANSVKATAQTEAITVWREIGGSLYAPWTDPRGSGPGTYSTDAGGSWHHIYGPVGVHWFDITGNAGTLTVAGSVDPSSAAAFQSRDGGATWTRAVGDTNATPDGYERYYWAATAAGQTYIQARDTDSSFKLRRWDGARWSLQRTATPVGSAMANRVESFAGMVVSYPKTIAGKGVVSTGLPAFLRDFYQYGGRLYALTQGGSVYVTDGTLTGGKSKALLWTFVTTGPSDASSLAIVNGVPYYGTPTGQLVRAS